MMTETLNQKLARMLTEHPDLPIKVSVDRRLAENAVSWSLDYGEYCMGTVRSCELTEYIDGELGNYFGRGNPDFTRVIREEVEHDNYGLLYSNEIDKLTEKTVRRYDRFWMPCIRIEVGE